MQDQIRLQNVRLSFPDLFEAKSVNNSEPKFGAVFLLNKNDDAAQIDAIRGLIWSLAKEKWADKAAAMIKSGKVKICLHEGAEKDYDGYGAENMFVSTTSKKRPTVVDRDRSPLTKDDSRPYAGCYVNAVIRFWVQDNQYGKRVNAQLQGVQFVDDGEAFGAAPFDAENAFDDLEGGKKREPAAEGAAPDDDDIPF